MQILGYELTRNGIEEDAVKNALLEQVWAGMPMS